MNFWDSPVTNWHHFLGLLGLQMCYIHPALTWMLRLQTQILMESWQVLYLLGHLLCPRIPCVCYLLLGHSWCGVV